MYEFIRLYPICARSIVSLPMKSVVRFTDLLMTIAVDWSVQPQTNQNINKVILKQNWPRGHKLFSFSTQLSMKFQLLIKAKMLKNNNFSCCQTLSWCI